MTVYEMAELFEKHDEEYLSGNICQPRDLAAIIRLLEIAPIDKRAISSAEHDQFWLSFDEEEVAKAITEDDVIFLKRCGVIYEEGMGFSFFA